MIKIYFLLFFLVTLMEGYTQPYLPLTTSSKQILTSTIAGDVGWYMTNPSATGYGIAIRNGNDAYYGLSIQSSVGANNINMYGDGHAIFAGNITAPTFIGALTGNASTATVLQTARAIQGVNFDGTAAINIINGTGFVKATGTTISYDNSTYLTTSAATAAYLPLTSTAHQDLLYNVGGTSMLQLTNINTTGYGTVMKINNDANYTLSIINAANTLNSINMYGDGHATFAGAISTGGLSATTGSFSGSVTVNGPSVSMNYLNANSGNFTGTVSMAGLNATTGTFVGQLTSTSAGGTTSVMAFKNSTSTNPYVALVGADNSIYGGTTNGDFGTYVYGTGSYYLATNGTKRLTIDGTGASVFSGSATANGVNIMSNSGLRFYNAGNSAFATLGFTGTSVTNNYDYSGTTGTFSGSLTAPSANINNTLFIGSVTPALAGTNALAVNGSAIFTKATVKLVSNWPDYVFEEGHHLSSIDELEKYIKLNHHLPEIPTAKEIEKNGIDLGTNQVLLLKKIEELTLMIIQQDKKIQNLQSIIIKKIND